MSVDAQLFTDALTGALEMRWSAPGELPQSTVRLVASGLAATLEEMLAGLTNDPRLPLLVELFSDVSRLCSTATSSSGCGTMSERHSSGPGPLCADRPHVAQDAADRLRRGLRAGAGLDELRDLARSAGPGLSGSEARELAAAGAAPVVLAELALAGRGTAEGLPVALAPPGQQFSVRDGLRAAAGPAAVIGRLAAGWTGSADELAEAAVELSGPPAPAV